MKKLAVDTGILLTLIAVVLIIYMPKDQKTKIAYEAATKQGEELDHVITSLDNPNTPQKTKSEIVAAYRSKYPKTLIMPISPFETPNDENAENKVKALQEKAATLEQQIDLIRKNQIPWWLSIVLPFLIPLFVSPLGKILEPTTLELGTRLKKKLLSEQLKEP